MAYRTFVDSKGVTWQVWEVRPTTVERRLGERRRTVTPYSGAERRAGGERRTRREQRVSLGPELSRGWLAFHSADEKRRYAPIPEDWASLSSPELAELSQQAKTIIALPDAQEGRDPDELDREEDSGGRKLSA